MFMPRDWLKCKFLCCFILAVDMVKNDIRKFVYDVDGPASLKRELVGFDVDRSEFTILHVDQCQFIHFKSNWPISPILKALYFIHWNWYIWLEDLSIVRSWILTYWYPSSPNPISIFLRNAGLSASYTNSQMPPQPCLPPIWNGILTCTSIQAVSWQISTKSYYTSPHPHFPSNSTC